jgi:hypothetical protein
VLTAKPPLPRYGVEMPRVNPFVTLVVSFISFSRVFGTAFPYTSHPRVRCAGCTPNNAGVARTISRRPNAGTTTLLLSHCLGYADVPSPLSSPHVLLQSSIAHFPLHAYMLNHDLIQASTSNQKAAVAPRILVGQVQLALHQPPPLIPQPPATELQCCPAGT